MTVENEAISPTGRAWIELDMAALRHNVKALRALLPKGCELMPVVKANAYGHGAILISQELNRAGIKAFCAATVSEGVELRKNGIAGELLILGYTHPSQFPLLSRYGLTQTVTECSYAEALDACGEEIRVQLKIDTGMHRLGERWDSMDALVPIFACRNLKITGAFTHLCADSTTSPRDRAVTMAQSRRFYDCISRLRARGCVIPKVHVLASHGLLHYPEIGGDYARIGIALYGVLSSGRDGEVCPVTLRPVLSLKARVAQVQELRQGESAGYDLKFTAQRDARIAVLTIGYADGLPRCLSCGVGSVLIHGRRAPIVGRICMDQTLVDVTDVPNVLPGDTAVLIGKSGTEEITACDLAEQAGTISNEILSRLGARCCRCAYL